MRKLLITLAVGISIACGLNIVGLLLDPPRKQCIVVEDRSVSRSRILSVQDFDRFRQEYALIGQLIRIPRSFQSRWEFSPQFGGGPLEHYWLAGDRPDIPMLAVSVSLTLLFCGGCVLLIRRTIRRLPQPRGFDVIPPT